MSVLLAIKSLYAYPVRANDLDYLCHCPFPVVGEVSVEPLINDYGEKHESSNRIINAAERYFRPIFVSTNLSKDEMLGR